jgi:hypothetical protein
MKTQPRQPVVAAGAAEENRPLVAHQLAAAAGEDGRPAGETRALLLAFAGRGAPESEAVREHVEDDCGAAPGGWLWNAERQGTSAPKSSSGGKCQERDRLEAGNNAEGQKRVAMPPKTGHGDFSLTAGRRGYMTCGSRERSISEIPDELSIIAAQNAPPA